MTVDKPKYDFYENAAFLDDPLNADLSRKARCTAPKIGTEPRVKFLNITPILDAIEYFGTDTRPLVFTQGSSRVC